MPLNPKDRNLAMQLTATFVSTFQIGGRALTPKMIADECVAKAVAVIERVDQEIAAGAASGNPEK